MIVLIDIDNTITNFSYVLLNELNAKYKTCFKYSDITSYDWFDNTFDSPWISTREYNFFDKVETDRQAIEYIEKWYNQGHKIYFVSASHFINSLGYKINKILKDFYFLNDRNIIIAQDKNMIRGDILIDDCPNNLIRFSGHKICFAQPWNKGYGFNLRTNNWQKINHYIKEIERAKK